MMKRLIRYSAIILVTILISFFIVSSASVRALDPVDRIDLENRDWVTLNGLNIPEFDYLNQWLTMYRIDINKPPYMKTDTTLRIRNSGTTNLVISDFAISNTVKFTLPNGELTSVTPGTPLTIAPGGFYDLLVRFIYAPFLSSERGVHIETLTITSNDSLYPSLGVTLAGGYQIIEGGTAELFLDHVVDAFGFTTNVGFTVPHSQLAAAVPSSPVGDEVFSKFWQRVDTSQPSYIRQLAALHGPSGETMTMSNGGGGFTHLASDFQTLLPRRTGGLPGEQLGNPGTPFETFMAGRTSCDGPCANTHGVRYYPARTPTGELIPGAWILGMDYVPPTAGTNYDYQDNVVLLTNAEPTTTTVDLQLSGTDSPDPVVVNDTLTYNLSIYNDSIFTAKGSTLELIFPIGSVNVISAVSSLGTCNTATPTLTCTIGFIGGEKTIDITVQVEPLNVGLLNVTANVTTTSNDTIASNNTLNLTTQVNPFGVPTPGYASSPAPGSTVNVGTANVGNSVSTTIQVSETGDAPLNVTLVNITGDFSVTGGLPMTLNDGAPPQDITVTCTPTAEGLLTGQLTVQTNEPGTPTYVYNLECTGTIPPAPVYGSTPAPGGTLNVGTALVGTPVSNTITISELGNAPLNVILVGITGPNATDFAVTGGLPMTLNDGDPPQNITVQCTPSAAGLRTATLTVSSNETGTPTYSYTLECTGTAVPTPGFDSTPVPGSTISFGFAGIGGSLNETLRISETGNDALTVTFVNLTDTVNFSVTGFPITLNDGDPPADVILTCAPTVDTPISATLTIQTNQPGNPTYNYTLICNVTDDNGNGGGGGGTTTVAGGINKFDPSISKIGLLQQGQLGAQGEQLEWIVTISNPSGVVGTNLVSVDVLRPELRIDRVEAPGGSVNISGQTVTVTYASLAPGQAVSYSIFTTVTSNGAIIENTACVTGDGAGERCASALAVQRLPNTGESPFWRQPLLVGLALATLLSALVLRAGRLQ